MTTTTTREQAEGQAIEKGNAAAAEGETSGTGSTTTREEAEEQATEKGNAAAAELAPCPFCGEPRGDASPCPHCGTD